MIKLVVFLSNNIKGYERTRHNVAKMLFDRFESQNLSVKFHSQHKKIGRPIFIAPLSFMNNSGIAVSEAVSFYKLKDDEILVVHDDAEIDLGAVKIEKGGPLRGHNGLRSIKDRIGSDNFFRMRIGIGRPKRGELRSHVLSAFSKDEEIPLETALEKAEEEIRKLL